MFFFVKEIKKRTKSNIPLLDPIEDMGIKDKSLIEIVKKIESVEEQVLEHKLHKDPSTADLYKRYEKKALVNFILQILSNILTKVCSSKNFKS